MFPILFLASLLAIIPIIQGAMVPFNVFTQFYHIFVYEMLNNKVPSMEAFLVKLHDKLLQPLCDDVHWQNAQKRYALVRPYMKYIPFRPLTAFNPSDKTFKSFQVEEYVSVTHQAFSNNRLTSEVLFDDAYFYWTMLRNNAGEDYEKRNALLGVLAQLRVLGMGYLPGTANSKVDWVAYYSDSWFLRETLKLSKTVSGEVEFLSRNEDFKKAFRSALEAAHEPSDSLQKRLEKFVEYQRISIQLPIRFSQKLNDIELMEMRSHLGPLQDYFPSFMRNRPEDMSRAFLNATMWKRYLERMKQVQVFPSVVLNSAYSAFSNMCIFYLLHWQAFSYSRGKTILSRKMTSYCDEDANLDDNAVHGCTPETFDAAVRLYGISSVALPPSPHDSKAASLAIVKKKEARLFIEAFAYRHFYQVRFQNAKKDMQEDFKKALIMAPEEKEFIDLVQSWVQAKVYANSKMPFMIPKKHLQSIIEFHNVASLQKNDDDPLWKAYKLEHIRSRIEIEMMVYDLSDDPDWKKLQWDYIMRLGWLGKQYQNK